MTRRTRRNPTVSADELLPSGLNNVLTKLRNNRSVILAGIGDSTMAGGAVNTAPWMTPLALRLGNYYDANVWMTKWDDTTLGGTWPMLSVLRTSSQGARTVTAGTGGSVVIGRPLTGDLEVTAKWKPVTSWATSGQSVIGKWGASGSQSFFLSVTAAFLKLYWSTTGTDTVSVLATAAVPFTGTATGWIRATLDVDNGASGNDVKFYTSNDGANWTQVGSTVTTSGVTSIFPANAQQYQLFSGDLSYVAIRDAVQNGKNVVPNIPDQWTGAVSALINGGPLIVLLNGALAAQSLPWADDPVRLPKILDPLGIDVVFTAMGINSPGYTDLRQWGDAYRTWMRHIKNLKPHTPIVAITQNNIFTGAGTTYNGLQYMADNAAARLMSLPGALAGEAGVTVLDTAQIYTDASMVQADGIHPTDASAQAQADWMMARLAPKTMR